MTKKIFTYRGHTPEELRAMSMDELVKIMPSRVRRSIKRGFSDMEKRLIAKIRNSRKALESGKKIEPIKTSCRNMPILPEMVGLEFEIHNGKEFKKIEILPEMVGQFLGEFSMTRTIVKHSAPGIGATRSSLFVPIK